MTANIPDSAVEAAAEALREAWPADFSARLLARAALTAALPILREELAKEVEAQKHPRPGMIGAAQNEAFTHAARIVRGGA